jgi:phosphoribosylanthranilate isomerase
MTIPAPRVKICGLTRLDDAELAAELGAWALGMVFYEPSPRRCSADEALRISAALRRRVSLCGVFVNASLQEIERHTEELGLALVQLHGDEGPAFCAEVARRAGVQVIKAVQVAGAGDVQDLARFHVDYHLVDTRSSVETTAGLRGGTGETFDWALLGARRSSVPLILSGGLRPDNVAAAVAAVRPFAVDTASGTEAAPGRKDPDRLRAFFDAVHGSAAPDAAVSVDAA